MTRELKGKDVAVKIKEDIRKKVQVLEAKGKKVTLGILRLGKHPSDLSYEKSIVKNCQELDIATRIIETSREISIEDLIETIEGLNTDENIDGILIFRPLPRHIDENIIKNIISPYKDIDCMHPINLEKVFEGNLSGFLPCTPRAGVELLKHYDIKLEGKNIVVINRTMVVGKPISMILLEENATVTICHSKTEELKNFTRRADIVISALGRAKALDETYFNENAIVIDIGVSLDSDKKISGDVDYERVFGKVQAITPVPAGVGSVTTSILLRQLVDSVN